MMFFSLWSMRFGVSLRLAHPSELFRPVLSAPCGRVVAGQDDIREPCWDTRIREPGRHWFHAVSLIVARRRGRERRRSLDQCPVILQPLAVVEGDGGHDAASATVGGGEAAILHGALRNNDLVGERAHADALDVDTELA